ncbi:MAG: hypothetical protein HXY34_06910 [Candidatus Thorarchaeota archaeon]|nr:hypothetical protein [Candidatus Thorarchaeota archaeon]
MSKEAEKRGGSTVYRVLSQDLYATGFHGDEVGIRQDEQWRAKSRQFTSDSDIIGKIMEARLKPGEKNLPPRVKTGFIVLRNSTWGQEPDEMKRRLVVKMFSSSGQWIASAEEMVADEYANSVASEMPLVSFAVLTKDTEIVTHVRQLRRGVASTESYSFHMPGPDGTFEVFNIEGKRATAGDDFRVMLLSGSVEVAQIDSKFGDIGGEFVVSVNDRILAENDQFCRILQCFSLIIRYRKDIRERIQRSLDMLTHGKAKPKQHRYELSLFINPRRLALKKDEFEEV